MTTLLLLLGAVGVSGIAVSTLLWRQLFRRAAAADASGGLFAPARRAAAYRPMNRLLAEEDFCFLRGLAQLRPGLVRRLRQTRVAVLRLYLWEMRADFDRLHALCRALATQSTDPNLGALMTKEVLRFYGQFGLLYAASFLPWYFDSRLRAMKLAEALARLEQSAWTSASLWTAPASSPRRT